MEFEDSLLIKCADNTIMTSAGETEVMTLQCLQCNTILADSFGVCGEMKCLDSDTVMCIKVTNDVVVGDAEESGQKGELVYSTLECRSCRCTVGKVFHSTPSHLTSIRSIFLLFKANITCYILDRCLVVKASMLTFDLKPLQETINEVRQQLEEQLAQMSCVISRLADRCYQ